MSAKRVIGDNSEKAPFLNLKIARPFEVVPSGKISTEFIELFDLYYLTRFWIAILISCLAYRLYLLTNRLCNCLAIYPIIGALEISSLATNEMGYNLVAR